MSRSSIRKEGVKNDPKLIDTEIRKLQIEKSLLLNQMLYSQNPEDILKAQMYVGNNTETKSNPKAYFFAPDYAFHSGKEYKDLNSSVPDNILRKISSVHVIDSIINTKINQVLDYLKFTTDEQSEGYTVRKKLSRFSDRTREKDMTDQEKETVEGIIDFLEDGGINAKWDIHDDLRGFVGKILRDTFTFNRVAFELERNMKNDLIRYIAIDAQTVRLLETIDPFFAATNHNGKMVEKKYQDQTYLPRYCQIWNGQIVENPVTKEQVLWYPWELAFEMRNPSTDIWRNGYPVSEIEVLSSIITWLLNGLQYNGNFFSQGSNPKGLLNVKNGDGGGQQILNQLRQMWSSSIAGVNNAHRMPVVEGLELEWINMQQTNKDMEFQLWNEFLIVMTCSVFTIDPTELGFQFKTQSQVFGQDGQQARLQHSKEKGLKPLLVFLQKIINKYIISELSDKYEFVFTGVDIEDDTKVIDNGIKLVNSGGISFEDWFEKNSNRPYDEKKDTILNPIFMQAQQMKMYGGQDSNEAVDQMTGEPEAGAQNPFDEYDTQKSEQNDPIWSATKQWLKENDLMK